MVQPKNNKNLGQCTKGTHTIRVLGPSKIKDHESTKGATIKQFTNPQDQGEPYKVDKQDQ